LSEPKGAGERNEIISFPWPYRRIATEEAFSVPEVYEALRGWAATANPAEPDQDFWDFVFTQDIPPPRPPMAAAWIAVSRNDPGVLPAGRAADAHRRREAQGVCGRLALGF
jgi:hypothetical protein